MTGYRHSQHLTDEVTRMARTPEAEALAERMTRVRRDRTFSFYLDGEFISSGTGTSDGYVTSGRIGSDSWLVRVHHDGLARFIAAAHILGALEGAEPPRWVTVG